MGRSRLGDALSNTLHAIAHDATQAWDATASAVSSAYIAASNGIVGAYNVTVAWRLSSFEQNVAAEAKKIGNDIVQGADDVYDFFSSLGPLAVATVFYDPTGIGVYQPGDPTATTSASGGFDLAIPVGSSGGIIVVQGGTDLSTDLPTQITLSAPFDATQVNPFTTLLDDVLNIDPSLTETSATTLIDQALVLPLVLKISQEDYLSGCPAGAPPLPRSLLRR